MTFFRYITASVITERRTKHIYEIRIGLNIMTSDIVISSLWSFEGAILMQTIGKSVATRFRARHSYLHY